MTRVLPAVLLVSAVASGAAARQPETVVCSAERTSAPVDARYEILRTSGGGRVLKVDKSTGQVWMLEHSGGFASRPGWRAIPPPDDRQPTIVNFQVVVSPTSGEAILMNLHSGNTWLLRDTRTSLEWVPIVPER
jgi:hypothetical protein